MLPRICVIRIHLKTRKEITGFLPRINQGFKKKRNQYLQIPISTHWLKKNPTINIISQQANKNKGHPINRLTNGPDDSLLQLPLLVSFDDLGANVGVPIVRAR